jgi:hypothetical protein
MTMLKYLIALFIFLSTTFSAFGQDTILIENDSFSLIVQETYQDAKLIHNQKLSVNKQVKGFHFRGSLLSIIEDWIAIAELESIELEMDGSRYKRRFRNFEDSTLIFNLRFEVIMTSKNTNSTTDFKQIQRAAFEAFIDLTEVELTKKKESKTFWELRLIDENTSAISIEQNKFWYRSDLEDYVYYERIDIKRIADLLGRQLYSFVLPVTHNFIKFDIKMPYSNDFFDLKYAMIEQGFELTEVTREIEVWVIKI